MPCVFTVASLVKHQTLLYENRCLRPLFFTLFLFLFFFPHWAVALQAFIWHRRAPPTQVFISVHLGQGWDVKMPYLQGKTKLPPDDELIPFTQALEDGPFTSVFHFFGGGFHVPCTVWVIHFRTSIRLCTFLEKMWWETHHVTPQLWITFIYKWLIQGCKYGLHSLRSNKLGPPHYTSVTYTQNRGTVTCLSSNVCV